MPRLPDACLVRSDGVDAMSGHISLESLKKKSDCIVSCPYHGRRPWGGQGDM